MQKVKHKRPAAGAGFKDQALFGDPDWITDRLDYQLFMYLSIVLSI
jgi:hypothetical protein